MKRNQMHKSCYANISLSSIQPKNIEGDFSKAYIGINKRGEIKLLQFVVNSGQVIQHRLDLLR
jgi:hypothetical protein